MKKEIDLVYMVAGISSRFGGKIKQFAEVGPQGETLMEYSLKQAAPAGFSRIVFIVGNRTEESFKQKFGNNWNGIPVEYAHQFYDGAERDRPWGTAEAISTLKGIVKNDFVVCNGDDIYWPSAFETLYRHFQENNEDGATLGYKLIDNIPKEGTTNRGLFEINNNGDLKDIKEVLGISRNNLDEKGLKVDDLVSMNIFGLKVGIIDELVLRFEKFKEDNKSDRKIEFLLPEEISKMIEEGKFKIKVYPAKENTIGLTNPEDEEIVKKLLKKL